MLVRRVVPIACVVALLALAPPARAQSAAQAGDARALADLSRSLQRIADKVGPSIVQIFVRGYATHDAENQTTAEPTLERSTGSGVIVDPDGYIVTNAHVVENATHLEVELPLGATGRVAGRSIVKRRGRTVGARLVAIDRETDIAVLRVDAKGLPALPFGDSDTLSPGQLVLAFGSPLGLEATVTMGVVSAIARQLVPEDPMIYIQTDAPINPGSSGGALVDTSGQLVGINTLIYSQSGGNEGIGFAAPSNIVRNVFTQIQKFGRVRRGQIGVNAQTVTPIMAEALGLQSDAGVIISDVESGGPAEKAGLRPGDLVITLDGKPMENGRQFRINIYTRGVGEQVALEIRRGDRRMNVRVPVVEREDAAARLAELVAGQQAIPGLGVVALDLTPQVAELLPPLRFEKGVVVVRVSPDAPYSQQGQLEPGDVIHAINGRAVAGVNDLKTELAALKPGAATVLQIAREGILLYVSFRAIR